VLDQLVDVLLLLLELRLDGLELGLLLLLDVHFFGGRLALGEGVTAKSISAISLYNRTSSMELLTQTAHRLLARHQIQRRRRPWRERTWRRGAPTRDGRS
jgi:hypothetical protein